MTRLPSRRERRAAARKADYRHWSTVWQQSHRTQRQPRYRPNVYDPDRVRARRDRARAAEARDRRRAGVTRG